MTPPETTPQQPLESALRTIDIFSDLRPDELQWFLSKAEERTFAPGEVLLREGDAPDSLFVLLEGTIRGRHEGTGSDVLGFSARAGQVTGLLPFSRMTRIRLTIRATAPVRLLRLHRDNFQEMLQRIPELLPRLVGVMADRIREYSRAEQQRDKLSALGKLSAGLAHELNNPAAAAMRAAQGLRESMQSLRNANRSLGRSLALL